MVARFIELTFTAIIVYLILSNAMGFSQAISSLGSAYAKSVSVLQGRSIG